jgi:hypothetical protein
VTVRVFNGSSQFFRRTDALVASPPLTIVFWARPLVITSGVPFSILNNAVTWNGYYCEFVAGGLFDAVAVTNNTFNKTNTVPVRVGVWQLFAAVFAASNDYWCTVLTPKGTLGRGSSSTNTVPAVTPNRTSYGASAHDTAVAHANIIAGPAAVYNCALTLGDLDRLRKMKPGAESFKRIRRQSLVEAWDMSGIGGNSSAELGSIAGLSFSQNNNPGLVPENPNVNPIISSFDRIWNKLNVSVSAYTLTMSAGSFSLTGIAVNLLTAKKLISSVGSFILSGKDVALARALKLISSVGTFSLTGNAANLLFGKSIAAGVGTFTLSGQSMNLLRAAKLVTSNGTFTLSGQDVAVKTARTLSIGTGVFALSGQDVTIFSGAQLVAAAGSFSFAGQNVSLLRASRVTASSGSFSFNGQVAALALGRKIIADRGAFALTGQAASFVYGKFVNATTGTFSLNGQSAGLRATRILSMGSGTFSFTGKAAVFSVLGQSFPTSVTLSDEALAYVTLTDFALTTISLSDEVSPY